MRAIPQHKAFKILISASLLLAVLLLSGLFHVLMAACPGNWADFLCVFIPTHHDMATHLLSYFLGGMVVVGTYRGLLIWHTQRKKLAFLTQNMKVLETSSGQGQPTVSITGLKNRVIFVDTEAPFCFCSGFVSPRIYLSHGMMEKLTTEETEAVLLHEKQHLENHDPLKILIGLVVVSALFFVPVLKDVFNRYLLRKELAADYCAITCQGHKRGLAGALYKMLGQEQKPMSFENIVASGTHLLEARIDYLVDNASSLRYRNSALRLVISLISVAFLGFVILAPLPTHIP